MQRIVILGGGYAGTLAAVRLGRKGVPVTLIDQGDGLVERIRQHQVMAGDDVPVVPFAKLFRRLPVTHVRARAESIDRAAKEVVTTEGRIAYDKLIYAIGSTLDTREHTLSLNDPRRVRDALRGAKSVIIVGGGLTGIESAVELAERHPELHVTVIDGGTAGGANLSPKGQAHLREVFDAKRITLLEETRIAETIPGGVVLESGETLEAGVVLWCGSFRVSPIAREAGLRVNARGQILVDEYLRSSDPSILAAGDAAAFRDVRMGCVSAMPMGAYAADFVSGAAREPFRMAFGIVCISLGRSNGLIQFTNPDDTPRDSFLGARPAAWVKELVCRYTVLSIRMESRGIPYTWPKGEAPRAGAAAIA